MPRFFIFLYVLSIEFIAIVICSVLYPFRSSKLNLPKPDSHDKPDVLCVHGFLHNDTPWAFYRHHLQAMGAGPVNTVYYPSLTKDIRENSLKIKERIKLIKSVTGRDVKVLIGHSLGGFECLEYALEHAPKDETILVITLATPLHGAKLASWSFGASSRQMQINSDYIKSLHERLHKAEHIRLLTIASKTDPLVFPKESALFPELSYAKCIELDAQGHVSMLFSKDIVEKIVDYMKQHKVL